MMDDQNTDPSGGDWWSTNAPPPPPQTIPPGYQWNPQTGRLEPTAENLATPLQTGNEPNFNPNANYNSGSWSNGQPTNAPAGWHWDQGTARFVQDATPTTTTPPPGQPPPAGGPAPTLPGAPINFGAAPPTYAAPTWDGGAPPSAPVIPKWTAPTIQDLFNSPGFESRFQTGQTALERGAAMRGTILNGGTQKALARYGQDYASNEYSNLVNQSLAGAGFNAAQQQTQFGDAFSNYQARYGQFSDAAAMGKGAFDTNVTNTRNNELDYWGRLNDLYQTGANSANNSYKPGA